MAPTLNRGNIYHYFSRKRDQTNFHFIKFGFVSNTYPKSSDSSQSIKGIEVSIIKANKQKGKNNNKQ